MKVTTNWQKHRKELKEKRKMKQERQKQYDKGYRNLLMRLMLTFGGVTRKGLYLLDVNKDVIKRMLNTLESEGIIQQIKYNQDRRVVSVARLINFGTNYPLYMSSLPVGYYKHYTNYGKQNSYDLGRSNTERFRRERAYRQCETGALMIASGVRAFPEEKIRILSRKENISGEPIYFMVSELRGDAKTESRALGYYFSEAGDYVVYHTGKKNMKWSQTVERGAVTMFDIIRREYRAVEDISPYVGQMLLLGEDAPIEKMLTHQNKKGTISLPSGYHEVLYIPINDTGKRILKTMSGKDWKKVLKNKYMPDYLPPQYQTGISHDGIKDDVMTLLFCIPDLERLSNFLTNAAWMPSKEFCIICYSSQAKLIENVKTDNVKIIKVSE